LIKILQIALARTVAMVKDHNSIFTFRENFMDFVTLALGIIIGLLIGFVIAWFWASSVATSKNTNAQTSEDELKALLAERASQHLQTSRSSIQGLQLELSNLLTSINDYESSLAQSSEDHTINTFFGEHASMFLRNSERNADRGSSNVVKNTVNVDKPNDLPKDYQPKDFANNGSGLFVGNAVMDSENTKEN
jgi:uncharacterized membrane-anchored protein YhcB (DUF1043 family)